MGHNRSAELKSWREGGLEVARSNTPPQSGWIERALDVPQAIRRELRKHSVFPKSWYPEVLIPKVFPRSFLLFPAAAIVATLAVTLAADQSPALLDAMSQELS